MSVPSLLLQFKDPPPSDLLQGARGRSEKLRVLQEFYEPRKIRLHTFLQKFDVKWNDLEALGAVIVHGDASALEELTSDSELAQVGVFVTEGGEFIAFAPSA